MPTNLKQMHFVWECLQTISGDFNIAIFIFYANGNTTFILALSKKKTPATSHMHDKKYYNLNYHIFMTSVKSLSGVY